MAKKDLAQVAEAFSEFSSEFSDLFKCHRYNNGKTAYRYLCGLVQTDKGNMERMEERVVGSDYETFQNFITDSPWSYRGVMDRVAQFADQLIGSDTTALIIDESCFEKKGSKSVGVGRQWNGRQGKVDNCQVGVFAALSKGNKVIPVDGELFLPASWTDDHSKCAKEKIPEDRWENGHLSKIEIAY